MPPAGRFLGDASRTKEGLRLTRTLCRVVHIAKLFFEREIPERSFVIGWTEIENNLTDIIAEQPAVAINRR